MSRRTARSRNLFGRVKNSTGLLMALAFALIGTGVVLFVFISNKPSGPGGTALRSERIKLGELPDNIGEATDITAPGKTSDARFQFADKKDASRVAIELLFRQMNPVGNAVYEATEPRAWVYMKDGRTVYIRADHARIKRVGTGNPESGEFRGNGIALIFPPRDAANAGRAIDPDHDAPGLVGHFSTASFDTVLLEVSSQEAFAVETEDVRLTGTGFVVRANQVQERLEFAKINSDGKIRYRMKDRAKEDATSLVGPPRPRGWRRPKASPPAEPPTMQTELASDESSPTSTEPPGEPALTANANAAGGLLVGPPAPSGSAPVAKVDLYAAEFRDSVTLVQSGRSLNADLLNVWMRVVDGQLPEDALGVPDSTIGATGAASPAAASVAMLPLSAQLATLSLLQVGGTASAPAESANQPRRALFNLSPTDVILTWSGPMVAKPISTAVPPAELGGAAANNHVHIRFTADRPGGQTRVTLTDKETGAAGICSVLDYAATRRELSLSSGTTADRVDFTLPGGSSASRFVVPNLKFNLTSGIGHVDGAGTLLQLPGEDPDLVTVRPQFPAIADPDAPLPEFITRRIRWQQQADFVFGVDDGRMTDALQSAAFKGDVVALDRRSWLSGESLQADFASTVAKKNALSRVRITGDAVAIARSSKEHAQDEMGPLQDSFVAAQSLDVAFAPGQFKASDDEPTRARADGKVVVGDKRGRLLAEHLDAQLVAKSRGAVEAGDVRALGGVQVMLAALGQGDAGEGQILAEADELHADGQQRWAELTADPAGSGRVVLSRGASRLSGLQMRLDEPTGRLDVFGEGELRHVELSNSASEATPVISDVLLEQADSSLLPPGVTVMRASWSRSMSYADKSGRIECHGDATVSSASADEGRVVRSERLLLDITPSDAARKGSNPPVTSANAGVITLASPGGGQTTDDRRLLRAEALGAATERDGGAPASVKTWRYSPAPTPQQRAELVGPTGPRSYEQVLYLEGPRIVVDEIAGTMTVPDAGRGVTFDQSPASARDWAQPATTGVLAGGSAGRSQFTWAGSLEFNRLTGALRMQKDVELRHLPLDSNELVRMVCDSLLASFNTRSGRGAELVSADAVGGVFAESGSRHLTSDQLSYEAASGIATARSNSESPVTMQDTRQGAPMLAKALRWDIRTDRIEISEPAPVTGGLSR